MYKGVYYKHGVEKQKNWFRVSDAVYMALAIMIAVTMIILVSGTVQRIDKGLFPAIEESWNDFADAIGSYVFGIERHTEPDIVYPMANKHIDIRPYT